MVVNRKQPVAPAPPISRSSSSQPVPTKRQTKTATPTPAHATNDTHSRKATPTPAKKSKPLAKTKKKSKSLFEYLFLVSLTAFTTYAFYTCRPNPLFPSSNPYSISHPEPALCRSLATYRTHILEPYILPPLQHTLSYTHKLSEPYVARTQAQLAPYLTPAKEALDKVTPYAKATAHTGTKVWKGTVVPAYHNVLKPYYDTAVVPRYKRYIQPRLIPLQAKAEKYFAFYISNPLLTQYNLILSKMYGLYVLYIDPYIRLAKPHLQHTYHTTSEFTKKASDIYVTEVHPRLVRAWVTARPGLCAAWKHSRTVSIHAFEVTSTFVKKVAQEAGVYRRTYVDPHLNRILEKVAETNASEVDSTVTTPLTSKAPLVADLPHTNVEEASTVESIPEPTAILSSSTMPVPTTEEVPDNTVVADPAVPTPPQESAAHEATVAETQHQATAAPDVETKSTVSTTIASTPSPTSQNALPAAEPTLELEAAEQKPEIEAAEPKSEIAAAPVSIIGVGATATGQPDEEDLDDFLKELGVDDEPKVVDAHAETPALTAFEEVHTPVPDSPEAREAHLAETAAKRADIVRRHNIWFGTLESMAESLALQLAETIGQIRKDAAKEVYGMSSGKDAKGKETGGAVGDVQKEGERLLRGLEGWLKKAEGRSVDWKSAKGDDEDVKKMKQVMVTKEKEKWSHVATKVEEKFSERVQTFQQEVHNWYVSVREEEVQAVLKAGAEVKNIAEQGQADLGLDYAWLDDVTYNDWQRYHDLMRAYERFDDKVRSIQNGTSEDPPSPEEPLVPALDDLQAEVQDVITGFNHALSGVRSKAAKVHSLRPIDDDEEDDGFFVIKDGQQRKDDLRGVDLGNIQLKKESGGVLPVKETSAEAKEEEEKVKQEALTALAAVEDAKAEGVFDAAKVIIGKDPVQVEQALKDVPVVPQHEEL